MMVVVLANLTEIGITDHEHSQYINTNDSYSISSCFLQNYSKCLLYFSKKRFTGAHKKKSLGTHPSSYKGIPEMASITPRAIYRPPQVHSATKEQPEGKQNESNKVYPLIQCVPWDDCAVLCCATATHLGCLVTSAIPLQLCSSSTPLCWISLSESCLCCFAYLQIYFGIFLALENLLI